MKITFSKPYEPNFISMTSIDIYMVAFYSGCDVPQFPRTVYAAEGGRGVISDVYICHCFANGNHFDTFSEIAVTQKRTHVEWRITPLAYHRDMALNSNAVMSPPPTPTCASHGVFSCDQAALWMVFSVCPPVRLSVSLSVTPFWLCFHHRIIMKFSGVITKDQGNVHVKCQGQRSKVKVTEVTTQISRFRTVTPVWIHIWWWNDTYSLMLLWRGALLFFKVIRQVSTSHGSKNRRIWPRLGVSGL